jgi:hypothetical protein
MTSELRQGGFNEVEPRFLPEKWGKSLGVFMIKSRGGIDERFTVD